MGWFSQFFHYILLCYPKFVKVQLSIKTNNPWILFQSIEGGATTFLALCACRHFYEGNDGKEKRVLASWMWQFQIIYSPQKNAFHFSNGKTILSLTKFIQQITNIYDTG